MREGLGMYKNTKLNEINPFHLTAAENDKLNMINSIKYSKFRKFQKENM